ncbi:hypothetical protein HZS55_08090 [Halosimplex rubrum]|uniref:Uncharacterized protein n=1 Tax=Halosimplex rubrum TaxID=869889 RepID=A0A7D5TL69_9EURY|nr:hypothetical protein [Halosimplex rubrum]QLH77252.1 hypothetical protein HZS55_08090 [Halosimplex rubrum]
MSDGGDRDGTPSWIDDQPRRPDASDETVRIETIPDDDAGTVTFAARRDSDGPTVAWITVDAATVVDLGAHN